jgi:hypothetical protein
MARNEREVHKKGRLMKEKVQGRKGRNMNV